MILDTPVRRSELAFIRHGLRQSMGRTHQPPDTIEEREEDPEDMSIHELHTQDGAVVIDGRAVTLARVGKLEANFAPVRLWDKEERSSLPADVRQMFVRAATAAVLAKTNRLSAPKVVTTDNKFLTRVLNLQSQLKTIRAHLVTYDIIDVMTIVIPVDVRDQVDLERQTYNLFDDHVQLHAVHVANSCTWYNRWTTDRYISENMALTFTFLQNNTEETLWSKCLEHCEEYNPIQ